MSLEAKSFFKNLLDSCSFPLVSIRKDDLRIVYANAAFLNLFDLKFKEVLMSPISIYCDLSLMKAKNESWIVRWFGKGQTLFYCRVCSYNFQFEGKEYVGIIFMTNYNNKLYSETDLLSLIKVLVVDDYPINISIAKHFLFNIGVKYVDTAENGLQAFEKIMQNSYNLILLDLDMPVMNGFELAEKVRNLENENKNTLIVAVSSHEQAEVEEKCKEAGIDEYLKKPLTLNSLKGVISKNLEKIIFHTL